MDADALILLRVLAESIHQRDPIIIDRAASDIVARLDGMRRLSPEEVVILDLAQALGDWAEALAEAFTQKEGM